MPQLRMNKPLEENICIHLFSVSAAMVGVCLYRLLESVTSKPAKSYFFFRKPLYPRLCPYFHVDRAFFFSYTFRILFPNRAHRNKERTAEVD